ncbi:MAG: hypothetical protein PHV51_11345 [Methanosarcinaceae archaeon]|nr:hypothetical protein [Methanosarcinaceae archaeon]MDD4498713.1 hypothetical protein [Methanosarcinaceae archaeon]
MEETKEKEMDEIDLFLDSQVKSEEELLQEKCERTFYAASNPTRRELIKSICFLGKSEKELLELTGLDSASLNFHIRVLINADFLFLGEDGTYRLTEIGLNVLPKL